MRQRSLTGSTSAMGSKTGGFLSAMSSGVVTVVSGVGSAFGSAFSKKRR